MTHLRTTTWTELGRPFAGEIERTPAGRPAVPIDLGEGEEIILDDLAWTRDLATAVAAGLSVLESEHGLPAAERADCGGDPVECVHEAARGQVEEERNVYRELLRRIDAANTMPDLTLVVREVRMALEFWRGRS